MTIGKYDQFNGRHKGPKIEDILTGQKLSFSLSPFEQPTKLDVEDVKRYMGVVRISLEHGGRTCALCMGVEHGGENNEIVLYPETSPTGRLHYHGWIVVKNIHSYVHLVKWLSEHNYAFEIDTIQDPLIWDKYCTKQSKIWELPFKANKIPYPIKIGLANGSMEREEIPLPSAKKAKGNRVTESCFLSKGFRGYVPNKDANPLDE